MITGTVQRFEGGAVTVNLGKTDALLPRSEQIPGDDLHPGERVRAVILDVRLPDMSGLDAFDEIRRIDPRLPVIVITAFAATETAIEAMKRGAFEYLLKPLDLGQLREVLGKALEQGRRTNVPALVGDEEGPADAPADDKPTPEV